METPLVDRRPADAKPLDNATVMRVARAIKAHHGSPAQKRAAFAAQYPEFLKSHPKLFEACLDPAFKLQYLQYMLDKKQSVEEGRATLDQADEEVYERLKQRYVYPLVEAAATTAAGETGTAGETADRRGGGGGGGGGASSSGDDASGAK
jgi:hypothetical protein